MELNEIQWKVMHGSEIEDVLTGFDWKEFEELCAQILERNSWNIRKNFRFKTERRYEIDILATLGNKSLAIDCKHWSIRSGKASQLRIAAENQKERVNQLKKIKFLYQFAQKDFETYPLIVTWYEEKLIREGEVWIVPVSKLNSFLLDLDSYLE